MNEVCDRIVPSVWRFLGNATHPSMLLVQRLHRSCSITSKVNHGQIYFDNL